MIGPSSLRTHDGRGGLTHALLAYTLMHTFLLIDFLVCLPIWSITTIFKRTFWLKRF
jgi:hypothetical protein